MTLKRAGFLRSAAPLQTKTSSTWECEYFRQFTINLLAPSVGVTSTFPSNKLVYILPIYANNAELLLFYLFFIFSVHHNKSGAGVKYVPLSGRISPKLYYFVFFTLCRKLAICTTCFTLVTASIVGRINTKWATSSRPCVYSHRLPTYFSFFPGFQADFNVRSVFVSG